MRRRAFTMIELMVVLLIIGVLAALLLPAVNGAMRTARRSAVTVELQSFTQGLASFAGKYGAPISRLACSETGDYSADFFDSRWPTRPDRHAIRLRTLNDLRRMWPKVALSTTPLAARDPAAPCVSNPLGISGIGWYDFNGNGRLDIAPYELTGDECLVFLLGGIPKPYATSAGGTGFGMIGFAKSPSNPFQPDTVIPCGSTAEQTLSRTPAIVEFRSGRLFDPDGDGMPSYADAYSGEGEPTPYAFFATPYDPSDCDFAVEPDGTASPVGAFKVGGRFMASPAPNPYTAGPTLPVTGAYESGPLATGVFTAAWEKPDTFQILSAGADRRFGPGGWRDGDKLPLPAVAGGQVPGGAVLPSDARDCERDNLANFASGMLGQ